MRPPTHIPWAEMIMNGRRSFQRLGLIDIPHGDGCRWARIQAHTHKGSGDAEDYHTAKMPPANVGLLDSELA